MKETMMYPETSERTTVDEMVANLVKARGTLSNLNLMDKAHALVDEAKANPSSVWDYRHLGLCFTLVSPPNAWLRFNGLPQTGSFILIESKDEGSRTVFFKKLKYASKAFDGEAWIGED